MANREPKLLLAVLKELTSKELKEFQWHLSQENYLDSFQHIPKGDLENADRQDTVDIMIRTYRNAPAVEITLKILKDINQNNLADKLSRDYAPTESHCNHGSLSLVAPLTALHTTPGLTMLPALTFRAEVRLFPMDGDKVRVEVIPESMVSPLTAHACSSMAPGGSSMALQSSSNTEDTSNIVCSNAQDHKQTPNEHIQKMLTKLNKCNKIRIQMLGSGAVGKSCMVSTFLTNQFPSEYVPSVFDRYVKDIGDAGCFGSLEIQDVTGLSDYDSLRRITYPETDVFLVCFSVVYPDSFEDVDMKWVPEINHYCPGTPFLLVGTQVDQRNDPRTLEKLAKDKKKPINSETAKKLASNLRAFKYVECSALTQEGLKDVFDYAILAVLRNDQQFKSKKCVLS